MNGPLPGNTQCEADHEFPEIRALMPGDPCDRGRWRAVMDWGQEGVPCDRGRWRAGIDWGLTASGIGGRDSCKHINAS